MTRAVIFCGAGESKSPILKAVFSSIVLEKKENNASQYTAVLATPAPYPCGMVSPTASDSDIEHALTWIVDTEAMKGVGVTD